MPKIIARIESQRGRKVTDPVDDLVIKGTHFVHPLDVDKEKGGFVADLVPGTYKLSVAVECFQKLRAYQFEVPLSSTKRRLTLEMKHRCSKLPFWRELHSDQQRLFESFQRGGPAAWKGLSDNEACTFFQVSYAMSQLAMANGVLSEYVQRVETVGGSQIRRKFMGKERVATGWRIHVVFKKALRGRIAKDLTKAGFKKDSGTTHPTHSRFSYTVSYRQQGSQPSLQVVLKPSHSKTGAFVGADVDLDCGDFHRSAPYDVYRGLIKKFPALKNIYAVK